MACRFGDGDRVADDLFVRSPRVPSVFETAQVVDRLRRETDKSDDWMPACEHRDLLGDPLAASSFTAARRFSYEPDGRD